MLSALKRNHYGILIDRIMIVQTPYRSYRPIVLLVGCVAVAAGVFAVLYLRREAVVQDNNQFNSATQITRIDAAHGQYSVAAGVWLDYAKGASNETHQIDAYASAAAMYVSDRKYQQALSVVQTAQAKDGQNYLLAEVGGQAAYAQGDKALAITYYKEVLKLLPDSLPDKRQEASDYQQIIQQLQGLK